MVVKIGFVNKFNLESRVNHNFFNKNQGNYAQHSQTHG